MEDYPALDAMELFGLLGGFADKDKRPDKCDCPDRDEHGPCDDCPDAPPWKPLEADF